MLDQYQSEVRYSLEHALPLFIQAFKACFTDDERKQLRTAIRERLPLYHVRNLLHTAMVRNMTGGQFDSAPFWAMEDAINFLVDVETRRWPYATEDTHFRYLTWSLENMQAAMRACAERIEP